MSRPRKSPRVTVAPDCPQKPKTNVGRTHQLWSQCCNSCAFHSSRACPSRLPSVIQLNEGRATPFLESMLSCRTLVGRKSSTSTIDKLLIQIVANPHATTSKTTPDFRRQPRKNSRIAVHPSVRSMRRGNGTGRLFRYCPAKLGADQLVWE